MVNIGFDTEGITIQGYCEERGILATMHIPREFVESYECEKPAVVAIPNCIKRMGGRCVSISVSWVDRWRVKNVFKSDNGVSYEALSVTMHVLLDQPSMDSGISFERYTTAKKCLGGVDTEVSVNNGIATFKGGAVKISMFVIGYPREPYCKISADRLKLLNKFLGSTINN